MSAAPAALQPRHGSPHPGAGLQTPPLRCPADTSPPLSPLSPRPTGFGPCREHQLIVATTHDGSVIESICAGRPQLFNGSVYLAAVLNLTAATDFVLGDGGHGQGHHNAALRPGCDYTALLRLVRLSPQVPIAGLPLAADAAGRGWAPRCIWVACEGTLLSRAWAGWCPWGPGPQPGHSVAPAGDLRCQVR